MILARWQGKPWIQSHLLPAVTALISQESEGGNEGQVEEVPRQLFDMLMDSLGKLSVYVRDVGDTIMSECIFNKILMSCIVSYGFGVKLDFSLAGKLNGIFSKDATSADNNKLGKFIL